MKTAILVLFLFTLFFPYLVQGQIYPRLYFETGVSFSKSENKDNRYEYYSGFMTLDYKSRFSFNNLLAPSVACRVNAEWPLGKQNYLNLGLQIQNVITRYHITGEISNQLSRWNFEESGKEKQIKLSFPIMLGHAFSRIKFKPAIFMGYRLSYIPSGNLNLKYWNASYSYFDSQTIIWSDEEDIELIGKSGEYFSSAKKLVSQLVFKVSATPWQRFYVNLNCSLGLKNSCKYTYYNRGNYSSSYTYRYYRVSNSDISISISYLFFNPDTNNKTKKQE